jgi:penicillin-binding protein 2
VAYWFESERKLPTGRLWAVFYTIIALTLVMLSGYWKLQIVDAQRYLEMADRNRIRSIPIPAPRGRMLDRENRVLVDSYPGFAVLLLRDDPKEVDKHLAAIAEGLGLEIADLQKQLEEAGSLANYEPIRIKLDASPADIAFVEAHRTDIPVLELLIQHRRNYLRGQMGDGFLSHVSGYVSEASEREIARSNGRYASGNVIGKAGLERQYNDMLMGVDGKRRAIVNSLGREVARLDQTEPIGGKDIQLTIDYDLQLVAETALAGRKGAVVALDPRTGEVLAMLSHPAPDPNLFAVRIAAEEWNALNEDPDKPLLNRAIQAQLAPGSVFKIVMAAAMLESDAVPETLQTFCPGYATFYGRMFRCHVYGKEGHGWMKLHTAITHSCDIFFYNVGQRLGIDRIAYYAEKVGLGRPTGIDLPSEASGLVPSQPWKQRVFKEKWYAGETISVAIGQGALTATPLQMAYSIGGIASGGVFRQPHLLKGTQGAEYHFALSEDTTEKVTQAMYGVVNEDGGTARGSRLEGIEFSGKTGTSQLISFEGLQRLRGKTGRRFTENAWFVGYAPRRNPEIVVAVLVEHGEHGSSAAAPIARDIIRRYYEKKGAKDQKQYRVDYQRYDLGRPANTTATALPVAAPAPVPAKPMVTAPAAPTPVPQKPATPGTAATTAEVRRRGEG